MVVNARPLSEPLAKKAREELNETPERLEQDLATIRDWLIHTPHLNARTDDQFLVPFIRSCKFQLERVKEKLEKYYSSRYTIPGFIAHPDPKDGLMEKLLKAGGFVAIPRPDDPCAPVTAIIRSVLYDPEVYSNETILEFCVLNIDYFLTHDDNMSVCGSVYIYDLADITMSHILQYTPLFLQRVIMFATQAMPLRVKGVHFVNAPPTFQNIFATARSFMPEKLKERLLMHKTFDDFYKYIPKSVLPTEMGGDAGPISVFAKQMEENFFAAREELLNNRNYGIDETKRPGKPKATNSDESVVGTFRKLAVD